MTEQAITKLITEMCQEDSRLKGKEVEVREIIQALLAAKPDASATPEFKEMLRTKLLSQKDDQPSTLKTRRWLMPLALGTAAIVAGVAAYPLIRQNSNGMKVTALGENAFGSISLNSAGDSSLRKTSGGAETATMSLDRDSSASAPAIDIAPLPVQSFRYVYTGEAVLQNESKLEVFRRAKSTGPSAKNILGDLGSLSLNKNAFADSTLQSISFGQGEDAYRADIDFANGRLSIILVGSSSGSEKTTAATSLPKEETVQITDDFLESFGISRSGYGDPIVTPGYNPVAGGGFGTDAMLIRETMDQQVIYPLIMNDKKVYDLGGNLVGMGLSVSATKKKVTLLNASFSNSFESSKYDAETSFQAIIEAAKLGGLQKYYSGEGEITEVSLEKPEFAYVQTTQYRNNTSEELLVPAYAFQVSEKDSDKGYLRTIIVPLVKGLLDQDMPGQIEPAVMPRPAL
ncbi:MAG: hypothetical protein K0S20_387 [Patescibacteria group bacterium]|jgi:hypothetical protein|nr:hypothetical protein [Patescibacteria group bacterium]